MSNYLPFSKIDYKRDFSWLDESHGILVSDVALNKATEFTKLGDKNRRVYCEKVITLYFLMVFSSPYLFPNLRFSCFYLEKKTGRLHWYPGKLKTMIKPDTQMQLSKVYERLYVEQKDDNLIIDGFFLTKPKNSEVYDRLVRLHTRNHFNGPIRFNFQSEIFNILRSFVFLTMNKMLPSLDFAKFSTVLFNLHIILAKSGLDFEFGPLARKAFKISKKKVIQ